MLRTESLPRPSSPGYAGKEPTQPPNWHELVVLDVVLNALTSGLFLVAAVGELARPDLFAPVAAWAYPVALALLAADLVCLVLDLGDPLRFHHMLRVFKPTSPMSLGTWFLTAYSVPLVLLVLTDAAVALGWWPGDAAAVRWGRTGLLLVGLPLAFGTMAYKGVLFSTSAQPGWRDARWLGAYHTASAVALGSGLLLLLATLTGHGPAAAVLRPAFGLLLVLQFIPLYRLAAEMRPALVRRYPAHQRRLTIAVVVGGGVVVPVAALLVGGLVPVSVAVGFALVGGWMVRHRVVWLPQPAHHAGAVRPADGG
jgi:hypothetical protein